jgi:hypothetical protein
MRPDELTFEQNTKRKALSRRWKVVKFFCTCIAVKSAVLLGCGFYKETLLAELSTAIGAIISLEVTAVGAWIGLETWNKGRKNPNESS